MTLGDIETGVRGLISDAEYDLTLIAQAANAFQNELFTNNKIRLMETEDDIFVSAGDTVADLPDDINTMLSLIVTSPQVLDIIDTYVEYRDFIKRYPQWATSTPAQIYHWTDFANQMRFATPVLAASTIHIDYIRNPVDMVNSTDTCEVPDQYAALMQHGTLAKLMEINEDYQEASTERQNYASMVTAFVAAEGRGQIKSGPTIMRTNRRRYGTYGGASSYWQ